MEQAIFVSCSAPQDFPKQTWKQEHQEKMDRIDQRIRLLRDEIYQLEREREIVWERMCLPPPGLAGIQ
jgi:hypothetical protein